MRERSTTDLQLQSVLTSLIGGIHFRLSGPGAHLGLPVAYTPFRVPDTARLTTVTELHFLDPLDRSSLQPIADNAVHWQSTTWRMGSTRSGEVSIELSRWTDSAWIPTANAVPDFRSVRIRPILGRLCTPAPWALNYPCDQAVIVNRLAACRAAVLHASGVAWTNRACLLCGPSGIGKTTLGRLCRDAGARLLNDDRMILRHHDGRLSVFATPWHGSDSSVDPVPASLSAILLLAQAPSTKLTRLEGPSAVAAVLANNIAPFYDRSRMESILDLLTEMTDSIPVFRMEFSPTSDAADVVRTLAVEAIQ